LSFGNAEWHSEHAASYFLANAGMA